jgi:putative protease
MSADQYDSPLPSAPTENLLPELLAPAGSMSKLRVALAYGADAVYLAGPRFGLRQGADNFDLAELAMAVPLAHEHGVRVYVTINGFLLSHELLDLPEYLSLLENLRVDAVIVSDLGVFETVRAHCELPIHLSTQASIHNGEHARFWAELGAERLILARETSIEAAAAIRQASGVAVEMFVHGSLCMAWSGHCTLSNFSSGRDSNRGGCSQSCRLNWREESDRARQGAFFSAPDLCGLDQLPRLRQAGIDSLKIEGRMKSPFYLASTLLAYRMALGRIAGSHATARFLLEAYPHRPYSEEPLLGLQTASPPRTQPSPAGTCDFIGLVLETRGDLALCQARAHLADSSQLLALAFDGTLKPLTGAEPKELDGRTLAALQPNQCFLTLRGPLQTSMVLLAPHALHP